MLYTTDLLLAIARELEPKVAEIGGHVAIGGSCVYRGYSKKDMDIMLYPHKKESPLVHLTVWNLLVSLGWEDAKPNSEATRIPDVLVMQKDGIRVDFFILSR